MTVHDPAGEELEHYTTSAGRIRVLSWLAASPSSRGCRRPADRYPWPGVRSTGPRGVPCSPPSRWVGSAGSAAARFEVALLLPHDAGTGVPWATLAVNGVGCLLIGVVVPLVEGRHPLLRPLLGVGVLGGLHDVLHVSPSTPWSSPSGAALWTAAAYAAGTPSPPPDRGVRRRLRHPPARRADRMTLLLVLLGGAVGAPARYLTDRFAEGPLAAGHAGGQRVRQRAAGPC